MKTAIITLILILGSFQAQDTFATPTSTAISSQTDSSLEVRSKGMKYTFTATPPDGTTAAELNLKLQNENDEVVKVSLKRSATTIEFSPGTPPERIDKILMYAAYLYGHTGVRKL